MQAFADYSQMAPSPPSREIQRRLAELAGGATDIDRTASLSRVPGSEDA
jgi:hypothetical protein